MSFKTRITDRRTLGWTAVTVSTVVASLWGAWGIIENFHEGWYGETLGANLAMLFAQYLSLALIFILLTLIAIRWRRVGTVVFVVSAIGLVLFFSGFGVAASALIIPPLLLLGLLFWFGRPTPKRYAALTAVLVPLVIIVGIGIPRGIRVSQRLDDGNLDSRLIEGNGVTLVWAPAGPGWPDHGLSWEEANEICRYLSADGTRLEVTPQDVWRLPTVDELVRSLTRRGENAGGVWDAAAAQASYAVKPDKETPLWNLISPVIYYWTSDLKEADRAYIVVYDGGVFPKNVAGMGSIGFRAVKAPGGPSDTGSTP